MTVQNSKLLKESDHYSFVHFEDKGVLLFNWKHVSGLSIQVFKRGIAEFAALCKAHKPANAVIDATELDQASPAVAWLRSQTTDRYGEAYTAWWTREVLPVYHDAGISGLAIATGDPSAPGELPASPPEVRFKMGYFPDLETSLDWKPV